MPKFVVLSYTGEVWPEVEMSPEEMQKVFEKFYAWTNNLQARGQYLSGAKLFDNEGRVIRAKGNEVLVSDGPFQEAKEMLGGFWILEAASYDEVLELLSDHPQLTLGGTLSVRQVEPT